MANYEWAIEGRQRREDHFPGSSQGLGSVLDLVMVKMSENLEIPDWFKERRLTAQEGSDHLTVIFRVEWKERTKNNSKERQKIQERMK